MKEIEKNFFSSFVLIIFLRSRKECCVFGLLNLSSVLNILGLLKSKLLTDERKITESAVLSEDCNKKGSNVSMLTSHYKVYSINSTKVSSRCQFDFLAALL